VSDHGPGREPMDVEHITHVRGHIRDAQSLGKSMRAAMDAWRNAGGRIRTDDFALLWRDEKRKLERSRGSA